ncbi:MAG TPA: ATP synthase subunit I [Clostridiales bacterium]|nr:ATP synthase subunit I [Clostridiales bacterium]
MKVNNIVKKETKNIAIGILICSVITQIIFLIFRQYSLAVFLGSLYGGIIALLNFFLMGLAVQKTADMTDPAAAKLKMQASYSMRQIGILIFLGAGMYFAVNYNIMHWIPMLLAILYPRITIAIGQYFRKEWREKEGDI